MGWRSADCIHAQETQRHRNRARPREAKIKATPGHEGTGRDVRGLLGLERFCFETEVLVPWVHPLCEETCELYKCGTHFSYLGHA